MLALNVSKIEEYTCPSDRRNEKERKSIELLSAFLKVLGWRYGAKW